MPDAYQKKITDTFTYRDGEVVIAFTVTIDYNLLGRMVWRAAKNKKGIKQAGPIQIKAAVIEGSVE